MKKDTDTYPVWTVRCTWRVTDSRDRPVCTFETADSETTAVDRAVFVLDHYQNSVARALVCVDVKQPDGTWADVPRSNTRLTGPVRFAFPAPTRSPGLMVRCNASVSVRTYFSQLSDLQRVPAGLKNLDRQRCDPRKG